jgi:DNA-binding transcriptional MerR regulator
MKALPNILEIPEQALDRAVVLFEKDYTSEALSFIDNHHRIINYWAEGVDLMPPAYEDSKRRKYSFFDLVWLRVVKELRDFGMEKEKIAVLKGELLSPPDHKGMLKLLKGHRKEIEEVLSKSYGVGSDKVKRLLEEYLSRHLEVQTLSFSLLALYIIHALTVRGEVRLLVSRTGNHHPYYSLSQGSASVTAELSDIYQSSHVSISLKEIISYFVSMPYVKDTVKQTVLSEKEWKLIELVRSSSPKSIKVHFDDSSGITMLEITRKKKVSLEARLTEIIVKGGYERIELITQDGNPVYYESTEKIKL